MLANKVAIITGSSSGLGVAIAKKFAAEGCAVVLAALNKAALEQVAGEIRQAYGVETLVVETNIADDAQVQNLVAETVKKFGRVDILINNAGVLDTGLKSAAQYLDSDWERVASVNQRGTMQMTRAVLPVMEKQGGGSIVMIASVAGQYGCGGAVYASSKGALIAFGKHIALRYAGTPTYIRCNVLCPGSIITPMTTGMDLSKVDQAMFQQMAKHADLKNCRPCQPDDVADTVLFLGSDASRAITGQVIVNDFGANL